MPEFQDSELNFVLNLIFSSSTAFYKIRKLVGGLSSEICKTEDPISFMSL